MLVERIIFNLVAFSLLIFIFFKMIKKNDTSYLFILTLQAIGILLGFIEIIWNLSFNAFLTTIEYVLSILLPVGVILFEKYGHSYPEVSTIYMAKFFSFWRQKKVAKKKLLKLVEHYPESYLGHKLLAEIYEQEGGTRKAIDEYVKVIDIHKKDYDSYYQIAYLLETLGKKEESIEMLNNLICKKPDYYKASQLLGRLLCEKEEFKEAITVYMNALKYSPEDYDIYYDLGIAYTRLNDFQNAKICYEKAAQINSQLYHAQYCLGMISLLYDDIQEAQKFFMNALREPQVEARSYYQLSRISILQQKKEQAINYLTLAIDLDATFSKQALKDPVFIPIQRYIPVKEKQKDLVGETEQKKCVQEKIQKAEEHLEKTYSLVGKISKNDIKKLHTFSDKYINIEEKERE